jgi:hypothetical protein
MDGGSDNAVKSARCGLALDYAQEDRVFARRNYPHQIGGIPLMIDTRARFDAPAAIEEKIVCRNAATHLRV